METLRNRWARSNKERCFFSSRLALMRIGFSKSKRRISLSPRHPQLRFSNLTNHRCQRVSRGWKSSCLIHITLSSSFSTSPFKKRLIPQWAHLIYIKKIIHHPLSLNKVIIPSQVILLYYFKLPRAFWIASNFSETKTNSPTRSFRTVYPPDPGHITYRAI